MFGIVFNWRWAGEEYDAVSEDMPVETSRSNVRGQSIIMEEEKYSIH
jgi:hypothetical protein